MLSNTQKTAVNFQAVTGTLQKSHPKSFFVIFHHNSEYARELYRDPDEKYYDDVQALIILQSMLMVDGKIMAEVINPKYLLEEE